jgi:hypothetical protein
LIVKIKILHRVILYSGELNRVYSGLMKKFIYIVSIIFATMANGQSTDVLIWKSDTLNLYSNPLELKADWEQLTPVITSQIELNRFEKSKDSVILINFWRNYKTEWFIENDSLYLTDLSSLYSSEKNIGLNKVFSTIEKRIFADWVNSSLTTFRGTCTVCMGIHHKNTSIYPNEKLLEFKNGVLIKTTDYKNSVLRESEFLSSDPNIYYSFIYRNVEWSKLPDLSNKHLQVWVSVEPRKNGKLRNIDWKNTYLIDGSNLIDDPENTYIKEAVRIAKKIPEWNVVIRHDKILNQNLSIVFNEQIKKKYGL